MVGSSQMVHSLNRPARRLFNSATHGLVTSSFSGSHQALAKDTDLLFWGAVCPGVPPPLAPTAAGRPQASQPQPRQAHAASQARQPLHLPAPTRTAGARGGKLPEDPPSDEALTADSFLPGADAVPPHTPWHRVRGSPEL